MRRPLIWLLGWVWWTVLPIRKAVAIHNYQRAFPERSSTELRKTVGELVTGYLDLLKGGPIQVENLDLVRQGGLCLAGHGGAWDLALVGAARQIPITIFLRPPTNPVARWLIERVRGRVDIEALSPHGSLLRAFRALDRGRLVVFVQDQRFNDGPRVPFFGHGARTSEGFGAIAWKTRAPLFGVWQTWTDGTHVARFEPLEIDIPTDKREAIEHLTAHSQAFYEAHIRATPHSWLWLHDRWR